MGCYTLIYSSRVARSIRYKDAEAIANHSSERNRAKGITGMLLYTPSHFLQVLEGPREAVRKLFETIAADPRHSEVRIIAEHAVEARAFEGFGMRVAMAPPAAARADFGRLDEDAAAALLKSAGREP